MFPVSLKAALKKRRQYTGKRRAAEKRKEIQQQKNEPTLPKTLLQTYFEALSTLEKMLDRGVIGLVSSPMPH
jgi:hypothetical protein